MEKSKQTTIDEISFKLSQPFPKEDIHWRIGRKGRPGTALALAYITSRMVMNRLDEVVGTENWQSKHIAYGPKTICHIGIKLNETTWTKPDVYKDEVRFNASHVFDYDLSKKSWDLF